MRITSSDQLKPGMEVYATMYLPSNGYGSIECKELTTKPYTCSLPVGCDIPTVKAIGRNIDGDKYVYRNTMSGWTTGPSLGDPYKGDVESEFHYRDFGVDADYNQHRLYDNYVEAKQYIDTMMELSITPSASI